MFPSLSSRENGKDASKKSRKKLGFNTCVIPEVSKETVGHIDGMKIVGVSNVGEAISYFR